MDGPGPPTSRLPRSSSPAPMAAGDADRCGCAARPDAETATPPCRRWACCASTRAGSTRIVEDQSVARPQQVGQVGEDADARAGPSAGQTQQPAGIPRVGGLLRDQLLGDSRNRASRGAAALTIARPTPEGPRPQSTVALPLRDQAATVLLPVDAPLPAQAAGLAVERPQVLVEELHAVRRGRLAPSGSRMASWSCQGLMDRWWRRRRSRGRPPPRRRGEPLADAARGNASLSPGHHRRRTRPPGRTPGLRRSSTPVSAATSRRP